MGFKIACGLALVLCSLRAANAGPAEAGAAPTTVAAPAADDVAQAKAHYERGMAHFQLDEYTEAIEQWEAGFRVKRDPAFLYNIAQAYRLSKNAEKALSFYGKYLKMSPKASNRTEVERHMAALEKLIKDQQKAASQPPTHAARATMPGLSGDSPSATTPTTPAKAEPAASANGRASRTTPEGKSTPGAEPAVVTTPAQTNPAASPAQTTPAAAPQPAAQATALPTAPPPQPSQPAALVAAPEPTPASQKPFYSRPLFWGIVGAAVVIGSAAAAIVLLSDSQKIDRLPDVSFR